MLDVKVGNNKCYEKEKLWTKKGNMYIYLSCQNVEKVFKDDIWYASEKLAKIWVESWLKLFCIMNAFLHIHTSP